MINREKNRQFVYKTINRILVNKYCKKENKTTLENNCNLVSIIMLSFNRVEETMFSIENIYKHTKVPFELILFDNNSDSEQLEQLRNFVKKYEGITLVESEENLGCAGGRVKAAEFAKGDYYLFLDNDIVVTPYYLENLLNTINLDKKTIATCAKVIFPDLTIQFNGGTLVEDKNFYRFNLVDSFKLFWDPSTTDNYMLCPWIPGGATLWKAKYYKQFPIEPKMKGSFEDNEVSLRINKAGYHQRNCPKAIMIHYHINFRDLIYKEEEKRYMSGRYNNERTISALRYFWKKHGKAFIFDNEEATYGFLGDYSKENIMKFLSKKS